MSGMRDRLKALVVDDDAVTRIAVEDCLDEAGFEVIEAAHGEAGLAAFHAQAPDVVLLDVMMPRLDGFAVCERLRSAPAGEHVPVLMMTGSDDVASVSRAFQCGATDFVTKPLNPELLVHRIRYMLRSRHMADLLRRREESRLCAANCPAGQLGAGSDLRAFHLLRCAGRTPGSRRVAGEPRGLPRVCSRSRARACRRRAGALRGARWRERARIRRAPSPGARDDHASRRRGDPR